MNIIHERIKAKKLIYEQMLVKKQQLQTELMSNPDVLNYLFHQNILSEKSQRKNEKSNSFYYIDKKNKVSKADSLYQMLCNYLNTQNVQFTFSQFEREKSFTKLYTECGLLNEQEEDLRKNLENLIRLKIELETLENIIEILENAVYGKKAQVPGISQKLLHEHDLNNLQKRKKLHHQQSST